MSEKRLKEFTKFDYREYGINYDSNFQEGIMPLGDSAIHKMFGEAFHPENSYYFQEKYYPSEDISAKINKKIMRQFWRDVYWYILYLRERDVDVIYYCDYYVDQSYCFSDLTNYQEYYLYGDDFFFQLFLTRLINLFANYIFGNKAEAFIKRIQEENPKDDENKFDIDDCATLLLDYMNFVARTRGWHKVFTLKELHDEFVYQKHKAELKELKKNIEDSSRYMSNLLDGKDKDTTENVREDFISYAQMLQSEEPVDKILDEILIKNGISSGESIKKLISKELPANQKERIDNALYALACAYSYNKINYKAPNEIIRDKIKEMSIR